MRVTRRERPDVPQEWPEKWVEVEILPFDRRMAREDSDGWLQWAPRECIVIRPWEYCVLGLLWPVLRFVYRKRLLGQSTDLKPFKEGK